MFRFRLLIINLQSKKKCLLCVRAISSSQGSMRRNNKLHWVEVLDNNIQVCLKKHEINFCT